MSEGLSRTVCLVHADRPATARCPSCRRFFCGECVTEHSGKLVCSACLEGELAAVKGDGEARPRLRLHPAAWLQCAGAVVLVWTLLYLFARFLGDIPDTFHDGTIWE